jgi:hypothetical protein
MSSCYGWQHLTNLITGTLMVFLSKVKTASFFRPTEAVTGATHPESLTEYFQIHLDFSIDRKDHAPGESRRISRA